MSQILDITIRKILDSRGNPTVEVDVFTDEGFGSAAAPSGASTGEHEVTSFPKEGVDHGVRLFKEEVAPKLIGQDVSDQRTIDRALHEIDGTENFSRIGGNMAVATSMAVAKAGADCSVLPLYRYLGGSMLGPDKIPRPLGNVIGGGRHAIGGTDIQEFLVFAEGPNSSESVFANAAVHKELGKRIKTKLPRDAIGKGDEGAWVARLKDVEALGLVAEVAKEISDKVGFKVSPAIDVAASEFFDGTHYVYKDQKLTPDEQVDYMAGLVKDYGLIIIEDPFDENDYDSYVKLTKIVGDKCLVVGDDLFVTNKARLQKGIEMGAANAILIKPNQIGTVSDTIDTIELAKNNNYELVISHRSGETTDATIAHIGTAYGCKAIKTGTVGGERIAKLNELIRIEENMQ